MIWSPSVIGKCSDPVRNLAPEQPTPPEDIENPIYFSGDVFGSNVGDVNGVVPEALLQDFLNKHSALNYPAAIESAMRLIDAVPDLPIGYYNLACALSRAGRIDEASAALGNAIDRGWRDAMHANIDPDFAPLRNEPAFAELLARMRTLQESERIVPSPLRVDPWEAVVADLLRETPALLARHHVPGASIALVRDGRVVWSAAFGGRDSRSQFPLRADDRFRMRAPLHFMAIAACDVLEQQAKMQLAPLVVEAANQHGNLTVVESGGGGVGLYPANLRDRGENRRSTSAGESVANIRAASRAFSRNSAYGLLRIAVEQASDESFPAFCERNLFTPLMVRSSTFAVPRDETVVVTGHSALGTPLRPNVMQGEFAPGGCVYMTAGDLARLIASTMETSPIGGDDAMREGAIPLGDGAIFDDDRQSAERAARLASAVELVTRADASLSGSLGLAIKRSESEYGVQYEMQEAAAGVVLLARWHPETRSGIVIVSNSVLAQRMADQIAHIALGGR